MRSFFITTLLTVCMLAFCSSAAAQNNTAKTTAACAATCKAKNQSGELSCKLSSPQLIKRKETVLKSLKKQILETRELPDGYAFKFPGTDKVLDELNEFIKTERTCCDFFIFGLSVSGDQSEAWLELTGPEGAKDFISAELGLVE
jgi:hypothetical protein